MIRPLRVRHRALIVALALLLPAGVVTGLLARAPIPVAPAAESVEELPLLPGAPIRGQVTRRAGGLALELQAEEGLARPHMLVYVTGDISTAGSGVPTDARLLGVLAGEQRRVFPLAEADAAFLVYSLGHQEVVARAPLPPAEGE